MSLADQQENIDRTDAMKASLLRRDIFLLLAFMGQHTASQVRIPQATIFFSCRSSKRLLFEPYRSLQQKGPVAVIVGDAKAVGPIRLTNPSHRGKEPFAMELRASVARVALRHDVNANQMFYRLKPFREGRLGINMNPQLLRVKVEAEQRLAILGQGDAATVAFSLRLVWQEFGKLPEQELPQQSTECHAPNKFRNRNSTVR